MIAVLDAEGNVEAIVSTLEGLDMTGRTSRAATEEDMPVEVPRRTGIQILNTYTPAQHARARRMLYATFPEGHPDAGEFVDPDGLVQRLMDFLLAFDGTLALDDPLHVNGTTLLRGIGVIESDEEFARILAGIPPQV
jgi:hypothetical protein